MTILMKQDTYVTGSLITAGTVVTFDDAFEAQLVNDGKAEWLVRKKDELSSYVKDTVSLLFSLDCPICVAPSGNIGPNGALSLGTSLTDFSDSGTSDVHKWLYMYFPANAAWSGAPAGFYLVQMSSNNSGTVYKNRFYSNINEVPTVPGEPTPITNGYGSATPYTGVGVAVSNALRISIPARKFGKGSFINLDFCQTNNSSANNKGVIFFLGTSEYITGNIVMTTNVLNRGSGGLYAVKGGYVSRSDPDRVGSMAGTYRRDADFSVEQILSARLDVANPADYACLDYLFLTGVLTGAMW